MPTGASVHLFPAAEHFITCSSSPLPVAPFFCFVSECACSEVVHLLISNPIPCLLSMHSERVFVCFYVSRFSCGRLQAVCPFFFFFSISTAQKCLVTNTQMFRFFSFSRIHPHVSFCLWRFGVLDEDAAVSVEFQDLPQSLLGCGHSFFGPLAWKEERKTKRVNGTN